MEKRTLGNSDLSITPVTLGAWALGGSMWGGQDDDASIATIHAALDAGINCIDTAPVYGMGHSELIVGRALQGRRSDVVVATKCGLSWDDPAGTFKFTMVDVDGSEHAIRYDLRPARIRQECEDSLRRLGVDVIDLYQIHWPDPARPVEEAIGELARLREAGKIRAIGVSNFSVAQLEASVKIAPIASVQPPYNLLERDIEQELVPFCQRHGIGIIPYSPIARGLLAGKFAPGHEFAGNDHRSGVKWFGPEYRPRVERGLETARALAKMHSTAAAPCTLANVATAWVIGQPGITSAIVGARTPEQARENARAGDIALTEAERDSLARAFG